MTADIYGSHSVVNQQYFSVFLWPVELDGANVDEVLHKTRGVGGGDGSPSTIASVSTDVAQRQQTSNPAVRDLSLSPPEGINIPTQRT